MTSLQSEHQTHGGSYLLSSHLTSAPSHMLQSSLLAKKDTNLSRSTVISNRTAKFTCVPAAGEFDVTKVAETCSNLDGASDASHGQGISTANQLLSSHKLLTTSATVNSLLNRLLVANRNLTNNLLTSSTASTKVASEPQERSQPKLESKSSICPGCTRLPQNVNMTKSSGAVLQPTKPAVKKQHVASPDFVPTCHSTDTSCQNSTKKPCNSKNKKAKKIMKDPSKLAATLAEKKKEKEEKKEESEDSADEDMCFGLFD